MTHDWTGGASQFADDGAHDPGLWPEGNYEGTYLRHEFGASSSKGTEYLRIWFDVQGAEKAVDLWLTDGCFVMNQKRLSALGYRGVWPDIEFSASPVGLYVKHEMYKGRIRERWDISTLAAKSPDQSVMARYFARLQNAMAQQPPTPAAPPAPPPRGVPAKAAAKPSAASAPARPSAAPPRPAAAPAAKEAAVVTDQDSAWAAWVEELGDKCDAAAFWSAVDAQRGNREVEEMTAKDWAEVAAACPPF